MSYTEIQQCVDEELLQKFDQTVLNMALTDIEGMQ